MPSWLLAWSSPLRLCPPPLIFDPVPLVSALTCRLAHLPSVAWPEQVFYGGEPRGENDVHSLDDVGSPILHKYEVYNDGPSTMETVDVLIDWPVEVQSPGPRGKWLLYLTKPPVVEGETGLPPPPPPPSRGPVVSTRGRRQVGEK